jgi:hypothetical protein
MRVKPAKAAVTAKPQRLQKGQSQQIICRQTYLLT